MSRFLPTRVLLSPFTDSLLEVLCLETSLADGGASSPCNITYEPLSAILEIYFRDSALSPHRDA
jgi:hypothetical protein